MANVLYTSGIPWLGLFADAATPSGMTIKVALMKSSYSPNKDHDTMTDTTPASNEVVDTAFGSYARQELLNQLETVNDTNDRVEYDGDDVTFPTLTTDDPVAGFIVYVDFTPGSPDDDNTQLLAYYDIVDRQPNGTNFVIAWSSLGLITAEQG